MLSPEARAVLPSTGEWDEWTVYVVESFYNFCFVVVMLWDIGGLTHWGRDKMATTLAGDTFKYKYVNENVLFSIKILLKFLSISNILALV